MPSALSPNGLVFCLGGADLEMREIRRLLEDAGHGARIHDKDLSWGARASAYLPEIRTALVRGQTPVLIELGDDLPADIPRAPLVIVDHHGERARAGSPCALRQIFDLIGGEAVAGWTRWRELVAANDVGHIRALRELGASDEEIRSVRDADRAAQGISPQVEAGSRAALRQAELIGQLLVIRTDQPTSSAIVDFLDPVYGGPGVDDVLVVMPDKLAFFGHGAAIDALADMDGCWFGGDLPTRGFWGIAEVSDARRSEVLRRLVTVLGDVADDD